MQPVAACTFASTLRDIKALSKNHSTFALRSSAALRPDGEPGGGAARMKGPCCLGVDLFVRFVSQPRPQSHRLSLRQLASAAPASASASAASAAATGPHVLRRECLQRGVQLRPLRCRRGQMNEERGALVEALGQAHKRHCAPIRARAVSGVHDLPAILSIRGGT